MTSARRRLAARAASSLLALTTLTIASAPAQAAVAPTYCTGRSMVSLVKTYSYGAEQLALRCGAPSWGFVHIKPRWDAAFDSMIALTIGRGEKVNDLQLDGGSKIFALFDSSCTELFRVIYNGRPLAPTALSTSRSDGRQTE